jgi:hypothetical protein
MIKRTLLVGKSIVDRDTYNKTIEIYTEGYKEFKPDLCLLVYLYGRELPDNVKYTILVDEPIWRLIWGGEIQPTQNVKASFRIEVSESLDESINILLRIIQDLNFYKDMSRSGSRILLLLEQLTEEYIFY